MLSPAELAALRRVDVLRYKGEREFYMKIKAEGLFETVVMLRELGLVRDEVLTKKGEKIVALHLAEQAKLEAWREKA